MLGTLILLYALDTGQIPTGCYVAAWGFTILQSAAYIVSAFAEYKKRR